MIDSIQKYFESCPLFASINQKLNIDYQGNEPDDFSLNTIPEDRLLNEDIIGNRYMQLSFSLTSRVYTTTDLDRIANLHFLDDIAEWVYEQNLAKNFPVLPKENQVPVELVVTNNGYLYSNDADIQNGVYQMQFKLYYKELI